LASPSSSCVLGSLAHFSRRGTCLCDRVIATGTLDYNKAVPAGLTLAFVGDSGVAHGDETLQLIKHEGASAVVFNGDTSYMQQNGDWVDLFKKHLGTTPFFLAARGSGTNSLGDLQERTSATWASSNTSQCRGDVGVQNVCTHRGMGLLLSGGSAQESACNADARQRKAFFERALYEFAQQDVQWPICVFDFHSNRAPTTGWTNYRLCLKRGALIITSHQHPYTRTHEVDMIDDKAPHVHISRRVESGSGIDGAAVMREGHSVVVFTGKQSVAADLGVGEAAIPSKHMSGVGHGAFFCRFHVAGDPDLAHCFFKDIAGHMADDFYLRRKDAVLAHV